MAISIDKERKLREQLEKMSEEELKKELVKHWGNNVAHVSKDVLIDLVLLAIAIDEESFRYLF